MRFADDLVHCDETRTKMEERLENWRKCLEDAGSKTEHLSPAANLQIIEMKGFDEECSTDLPQVLAFEYLKTTIEKMHRID